MRCVRTVKYADARVYRRMRALVTQVVYVYTISIRRLRVNKFIRFDSTVIRKIGKEEVGEGTFHYPF